jgi:hypothetical protein
MNVAGEIQIGFDFSLLCEMSWNRHLNCRWGIHLQGRALRQPTLRI